MAYTTGVGNLWHTNICYNRIRILITQVRVQNFVNTQLHDKQVPT